MHCDANKKGKSIVSVRASEVVDFSSQYGSSEALSYTAENIIGPPAIFPRTGDNAYSYQLKTYGEWWQILPSTPKTKILLPYDTPVESQDFIEFRVETRIIPLLLRVYEVYNPGAIVKVFCYCYETKKWVVMWKGEPQILFPDKSHCFTIDIHGIDFLTDFYRLEFHHKHLNYFCEIDGLILYGEERYSSCFFSNYGFPGSLNLTRTQKYIGCSKEETSFSKEIAENVSSFSILPDEVVTMILSYLDLQSLCTTARVSKRFYKLCYDPVLFQDLNLQLYWHLVDANAMKSLQSRLSSLKKLNVAWCGGQGRITSQDFIKFLKENCANLTSLKLANCHFVCNNTLKEIASHCSFLKELELQSCLTADLTQRGFLCIAKITNVTYLDLYRTLIDKTSLITIIKSLKLEHLLLGGCSNINGINEVINAISKYLKHSLKTLDLWRATNVSCRGVKDLAECINLVELDLGWCYQIDPSCGCIRQLVTHCPKLKKLFLTAIRTITNSELDAIAMNCPEMEQLDILGTSEYNVASVKNLLESCKNMKLLDISYSASEVKMSVSTLRTTFPSVKIKCSLPYNVNEYYC
ncbi:hypothetical protein CDAR_320621 [Caerostris darwini]|uniref:F-box domain-containing protein n=1 Tax=Caerostris darwini TaxID=1538125 RepID=A0AAV4WYU1_9ARAC|nr:hypothetical protein CDAR_320621 [Caerostris darwini]